MMAFSLSPISALAQSDAAFKAMLMAQADSNCGSTTPSFCINETVIYGATEFQIAAIAPNSVYRLKDLKGNLVSSTYVASELAKTKGTGPTNPSFRVGERVIYGTGELTVAGYLSNGLYKIKSQSGSIAPSTYEASELAKTKGAGPTSPSFRVGERVIYGNNEFIVAGFLSNGLYKIKSQSGSISSSTYGANELVKVKNGIGGLACQGTDASISDSSTDVLNTYLALAQVSTSERAAFLRNISQYIVPVNRGDVNTFARFVLARIVKSSTAKVVQSGFSKMMEADQLELAKLGYKSIDQIEVNAATLDFAMRVLYAGLKLRMDMPNATEQLRPYITELTATAAETKLSAKISRLVNLVKQIQPTLLELMQDPRHGALGEVTQDVAGWVLKN